MFYVPGFFPPCRASHWSSENTTSMIQKSGPVAYWRRLNDALVEAGEPPLASGEAYDFYKSGLSPEDALILKLFGAEQAAPRNLSEAFDRTFGTA
jgi:hypothetical protein